jgi:lipase chaperone LimK
MPDTPTPTIEQRLDALILAFGQEAATSPDEALVQRAMRYRSHLVGVRSHWLSGEPSPVRAAKAPKPAAKNAAA